MQPGFCISAKFPGHRCPCPWPEAHSVGHKEMEDTLIMHIQNDNVFDVTPGLQNDRSQFEISCVTHVRKFQGSGFAVRHRGGPTSDTTLQTIEFAVWPPPTGAVSTMPALQLALELPSCK